MTDGKQVAKKAAGKLPQKLAQHAFAGRSDLDRGTASITRNWPSRRRTYQPDSRAMADLAGEAGQKDRTGKRPTAEAFRKVFLRVERDLGQGKLAAAKGPPQPAPRSSASPANPPSEEEPDEPSRPSFTPIRDKK